MMPRAPTLSSVLAELVKGRRQVLTLRWPLPLQVEVPGYVVPQEKGEG
ncbi:hypothetical protein U0070_009111, partial [Myodes glareolus]